MKPPSGIIIEATLPEWRGFAEVHQKPAGDGVGERAARRERHRARREAYARHEVDPRRTINVRADRHRNAERRRHAV